MDEKEEKKLEKRIAMLCICMCMMIITAVCSKLFVLTTLQSTDTNEQSCRHDAINQSVRNTNNTHKFTHSITHIEQLHAVQSECVSERWITSSSYDEVYII